jgi:hypothetical protein
LNEILRRAADIDPGGDESDIEIDVLSEDAVEDDEMD